MNQDIRTALIAFTAGIAATAVVAAVLDSGIDAEVEEWIHRMRMTPAERAEYDALVEAEKQNNADTPREYIRRAEATFALWRPEMVVTVTDRTITTPTDFTVPELLGELRERKALLATARNGYYRTSRGSEEIQAGTDQMAALRAEFDIRRVRSWKLPPLDRRRINAAAAEVYRSTDYPELFGQSTDQH
ncbi:hypothetical protein ACTD5D_41155 [Nocardia takedensis]|uniref:hypothetical protein n=1 Tax=Nocardia takedensis TaxID=259390 RepID=UPI003F75C75C